MEEDNEKRFNRLIAKERPVLLGLTRHHLIELLFLLLYASLPFSFLVLTSWKNVFSLDREGSPSWRTCAFSNYLNSPYFFSAVAIYSMLGGVACLRFAKTLSRMKSHVDRLRGRQGRRRSNTQLTLRIWFRRHCYFSSLLLITMLFATFFGLSAFFWGSATTYKEAVHDYIRCRRTFSCERQCIFKPPEAISSPLVLMFSRTVTFVIFTGRFAWIFFAELDWGVLCRFRPKFRF